MTTIKAKEVFQFCDSCKTETSHKEKGGSFSCVQCGKDYKPQKSKKKNEPEKEKPKVESKTKRGKAEVWDIREYDGVPYQKKPDGRWLRYHG